MALSPFSVSHDWSILWKRVDAWTSQPKGLGESQKEYRALQDLSSVGVIGGLQLKRLFLNHDKNRLKRMIRHQKIIRHVMMKDKQEIPVYTLGPAGAAMVGIDYTPNYWVTYRTEDILKRLLFFQLYGKFPKAKILPAPDPFVGAIQFKSHLFYIYVLREEIQDLMMFLKWKSFTERMLIVTESVHHLQPLNVFAPDIKARVTTDADLKGDFNHLFYKWEESWVKEN